tara:strand:- start:291 stop:533 length:243 start_codon:yes stop_codon:yes gene_type:complete
MSAHNPTKDQLQLMNSFARDLVESGADAIVVVFSTTTRNKTRSFVSQFGNELLCSSLITHAYQTESIVYDAIEEELEDDE